MQSIQLVVKNQSSGREIIFSNQNIKKNKPWVISASKTATAKSIINPRIFFRQKVRSKEKRVHRRCLSIRAMCTDYTWYRHEPQC